MKKKIEEKEREGEEPFVGKRFQQPPNPLFLPINERKITFHVCRSPPRELVRICKETVIHPRVSLVNHRHR